MPKLIEGCDAREDVCALNGFWVMAGAQLGGIRLPSEAFPGLALHFHNGNFVLGNDEGLITVNRQVSPSTMDIVATRGPNIGRVIPAIFEHAGGTLRICCDLSGITRPREFKAPPGTRRLLATYRRPVLGPSRSAADLPAVVFRDRAKR